MVDSALYCEVTMETLTAYDQAIRLQPGNYAGGAQARE